MIAEATLIPAAFAAVSSLAQRIASGLAEGLSFQHLLAAEANDSVESAPTVPPAELQGSFQTPAGDRARQMALQQTIRHLSKTLHTMLERRFSEQGIDLQQPAVLEIDEDGRLLESSGHPDRADIELLLESDPELAGGLRQFIQQASLMSQQALTDPDRQVLGKPSLVVDSKQVQLQFD